MENDRVLIEIDKEVNRLLAWFSFWEFCLFYDYDFFSRRPFLKKVADAFQYVYEEYIRGRARKITISMPPRAGKSYITSLFCAWWLAKLPELSVMRNCCTAKLYDKFSYDVRNIVRSELYKAVFPTVKLASDKQNLDGWNLETAKQVSYFGAGVGGTIIGFGANIAISDDLYRNLEDALSPNYNDKILTWKGSAHDSRKEKNCPELFIGTRWSRKDVIGVAIDGGTVDMQVKIAALDDKGNTFCDDVKSTEEYIAVKKDLDDSIWDAEYMQEPVELKGLLFPLSSLMTYNPSDFNISAISDFRAGVIDPADTGGDDLAFVIGYLVENRIYIHDILYNSYGTDATEPACLALIKKHELNHLIIEANGGWITFGKSVQRKAKEVWANCVIRLFPNTTNKHTRIFAQSAFIKNHFVFRSDWEQLPEYRKFMKCLTSYMVLGEGARQLHDDAPDASAGLADFFYNRFKHLW